MFHHRSAPEAFARIHGDPQVAEAARRRAGIGPLLEQQREVRSADTGQMVTRRFYVENPGLNQLEAIDASNECRHGRCPFDTSTPPCGCFPIEGGAVIAVPKRPARRSARAA